MNSISKISGYFSLHPQKLFLLDSIGAFLTACMLGLMLTFFRKLTGIHIEILASLFSVAVAYSIYSSYCYLIQPEKWWNFLKVIAIANIIYAGGIIIYLIQCYSHINILAIPYFIIESAIIISLVGLELKIIKNSSQL